MAIRPPRRPARPPPRPASRPLPRPTPRPSRARPSRARLSRVGRACWAWVLSWQMAMGKINTFTMSTFALPSFMAPNTSSATSCARSFTCVLHVSPEGRRGGGACVAKSFIAMSKKPNTPSAPSSAAPGFRRLKMARATMNTFNNYLRRRWWWWWRRRRRRRWWLCVVGSLLSEHTHIQHLLRPALRESV